MLHISHAVCIYTVRTRCCGAAVSGQKASQDATAAKVWWRSSGRDSSRHLVAILSSLSLLVLCTQYTFDGPLTLLLIESLPPTHHTPPTIPITGHSHVSFRHVNRSEFLKNKQIIHLIIQNTKIASLTTAQPLIFYGLGSANISNKIKTKLTPRSVDKKTY